MILRGWQIDGFGRFREWSSGALSDGLTVIEGPNEAGKSTLLAFVRGVLFGFPDKRSKGSQPLYEPPDGGSFGGRLFLEHDGRSYTVARHARGTRKAPSVTDADGNAVPEGELRQLLGGADETLFRNVFGFSLSELQEQDTLTEEGVRDRIFAGAIAGAGRSARKAAQELGQAAEELYRPDGRSKKNKAAGLLDQLRGVDAELSGARAAAHDYPEKLQTERAAAEEVERVRGELEALRRRQAWLAGLLRLRPVWNDRETALAELERAGAGPFARAEPIQPPPELAELQQRAERLNRSAELQQKWLDDAAELRTALAGHDERIDRTLAELGPDWTVERVDAFTLPIPTREEIRAWQDALDAAEAAVEKAEARLEDMRRQAEEAQEKHAALERELEAFEASPAALETLQARQRDLETLRGTLAEFTRQQQAAGHAKALADERGKRVQDLRAQRPGPLGYAVAGGLTAVAVAAAAYLVGAAGPDIAAAVAGLGVLAAAGLAWTVRHRRKMMAERVEAAEADRHAAAGDAETQDAEVDRLEADLRERSAELGFAELPGEADVAGAMAQLQQDLDWRQQIDAKAREVRDAKAELDRRDKRREGEEKGLHAARQARGDKYQGWAAWKRERGFPEPLTPQGVREFAEKVEAAQATLRDKRDTEARLAELGKAIAAWEDEVRAVLQARDAATEEAGVALIARFAAVADAIAAEQDAYRRGQEAEQAIAREAGHDAARAGELRETLHAGSAEDWERDKAELEETLAATDEAYREAVRAHQEAERDRKDVERSDRIAELEVRRNALIGEIESAYRQWQVYSAARTLVEDTLVKFERERQPAVFANASARLERITGGRYRRIVQESEGDGFAVLDRDDRKVAPLDLSRGTREQLYLTVRLGLIEEFVQHGTSLPLVLDEILVNFDPERMLAVATELGQFARDHQVLLFTCHPEIARRVQDAADARIVQIADA